ncbi:hypothetical protein SAMN05216170_0470 [Thermococcus thioreducens]|nr:hypothetical protein SAMN05216170_0470 [Thermococcus thioreducens]
MDTNVVLAALLVKILDGEFITNYTTEEALYELSIKMGILAEKGKLSEDWKRILARYLKGSVVVPSFETFNFSRDPDDNKWLGIAYKAKAEYILTWDKDLLELRGDNKTLSLGTHVVMILKPIEFYHEVLKAEC